MSEKIVQLNEEVIKGQLLSVATCSWPGWGQAGGWQQVPRYAGDRGRSIHQSQVPAVRRPLLS